MRIALRAPVPPGIHMEIHEPVLLPIDWERWCHAKLAAVPLAPLRDEFIVALAEQ